MKHAMTNDRVLSIQKELRRLAGKVQSSAIGICHIAANVNLVNPKIAVVCQAVRFYEGKSSPTAPRYQLNIAITVQRLDNATLLQSNVCSIAAAIYCYNKSSPIAVIRYLRWVPVACDPPFTLCAVNLSRMSNFGLKLTNRKN